MATATSNLPAVQNGPPATAQRDTELSAEIMEKVIAGGDLSKLSPQQRVLLYRSRCEAAGLDFRTSPFEFIMLNGKLVLYAKKTATDGLIAVHKLTVEIMDRQHLTDIGIFEVRCRVTFPDSHHVEDFAAVSVAGLKGEAFCNALMKGVTKAKRRTVLSACGLGMLDESEVDSIPGARRAENGGHTHEEPRQTARDRLNDDLDRKAAQKPSDEPAKPSTVKAFRPEILTGFLNDMKGFIPEKNAIWKDQHADAQGELPEGLKDLVSEPQVTMHLLKWAVATKRLSDHPHLSLDKDGKLVGCGPLGDAQRYCAIVLGKENPEAESALWAEAERYVEQKAQEATKREEAGEVPDGPDDGELPY